MDPPVSVECSCVWSVGDGYMDFLSLLFFLIKPIGSIYIKRIKTGLKYKNRAQECGSRSNTEAHKNPEFCPLRQKVTAIITECFKRTTNIVRPSYGSMNHISDKLHQTNKPEI